MASMLRKANRLWVGGLVTVVLLVGTTITVFAAAGNKTFLFTVSPTSAVQGSSQAFQLKLTNTSPGPSNIGSFQVTVPPQFTASAEGTALNPPPASSNTNSKAIVTVSGDKVNVTSLDQTKPLQFVTLTVQTTVGSNLTNLTDCPDGTKSSCSNAWIVKPWTGTALNGDSFVDNSAGSDLNSHKTKLYEGTITCGSSFTSDGTTVNLTTPSTSGCSFPINAAAGSVDIAKGNVNQRFDITIDWGLAVPTNDPQSAKTTITVGGQTFTPAACNLAVNDGYPVNPDTDGNFWPAGTAQQPWCLASYNWDGTTLHQTFKGQGDPSFTRTK